MGENMAAAMAKDGSGGVLKLDSKLLSVAAVTALFLASFFLWTLPFQHNRLPFGEGDSAWHFAIGDHISSTDKATWSLPYYVALWYGGFNVQGAFEPEYPPPNHANYALMQILGGERFIPVLIYRAMASFVGAIAVFFIISRLFGILPGFLSGLGLSFSIREQLMYLFGQQPTVVSLAITPVTVYAWYKYLISYYEDGNGGRRIYLFMAGALLAAQYLLHIQGFLGSAVIIAVLTAALAIRFRKLPAAKNNFKMLALAAVAFAVVTAPFLRIYIGTGGEELKLALNLEKLGGWGITPAQVMGNFPEGSVKFSAEYPGILPVFLFAGIALLLLRTFLVKNNTKEIFMLSWLIGIYIILHFDAITASGHARLARMLILENHLFYSLIALSVVWLPATIGTILNSIGRADAQRRLHRLWFNKAIPTTAKYFLAAALAFTLISTAGAQTQDRLKAAYSDITRITPLQAGFAQEVLGKLPEKAFVYDTILPGQPGLQYRVFRYPKIRWMLAISQRYVGRNTPINNTMVADINETYYLFDYSDIAVFASSSDPGTQQFGLYLANELRKVELDLFNNTRPVYNKDNIHLYKYHTGIKEVPR